MRHHLRGLSVVAAGALATLAVSGLPAIASARAPHAAASPAPAPAPAHLGLTEARQPAAAPQCVGVTSGNGPRAALRLHRPKARAGRVARPQVTHTLTVDGTGISGRPAGGLNDTVFVFNVDNSSLFDNFQTSIQKFANGTAKFTVPAGHYWAVGDFHKSLSAQKTWAEYLDVIPEFTVNANTTLHLTAKAATSEVRTVVPKPSVPQYLTFQMIRKAAAGPPVSLGWQEVDDNTPGAPMPSLYVNPTHTAPATGQLNTVTTEQLGSSLLPQGSKYLYDAAFQSTGTIPAQQRTITQASLATLHLRFYSAVSSTGLTGTFPAYPIGLTCGFGSATFAVLHLPTTQTTYVNANPGLAWTTWSIQSEAKDESGGQMGPLLAYRPGQQVTEDFGAYPLHPAPNVRFSDTPAQGPVQVSASRAGNTLRLALTAFSDSVPGHLGQGDDPPAVKPTASYQLDQNGKRIAGGPVANFIAPFAASATLGSAPSTVQLTLHTTQPATFSPLSTATDTVWTWRSAPASGASVPAGWTCQAATMPTDRACQAQPMMTLRYAVAGLGLNGSTAAGPQQVSIVPGHLQLAQAAKVTGVTVSVSFDGGKTWQNAKVTSGTGGYTATFPAKAGAMVTLRTKAADAAGGSISETITNAYQVGS